MTTRKPRKVERHKRDYIFVSKKEFLSRRASGEFLEWARVGDEYYATPKGFAKRQIESGNHVLLTIDVQGARQVKKKFPGAILIFILPPSLAALHRRLSHRSTESDAQIKRRLKLAKKEIAQAKHYDFVVINHKLEKAAEALRRIIHDELYTDR